MDDDGPDIEEDLRRREREADERERHRLRAKALPSILDEWDADAARLGEPQRAWPW